MIVIGLCGQPLSGKDTAARYIASKGFIHFSGGDAIREDMKKQGLSLERNLMRDFSTQKRKEIGLFYPLNEICPRVKENSIISGFRNTAEVIYTKDFFKDRFILVALSVPIEIRYERALLRQREGDNISFEEFKRQENDERSGNPAHELDKVLAMSDYTIDNSRNSQADLHKNIDEVLEKIKNKFKTDS